LTVLVLDASIAVAWAFPDESNELADRALAVLGNDYQAICPPMWPYEVTNALSNGVRTQRFTDDEGAAIATRLENIAAFVDLLSIPVAELLGPVRDAARAYKLTIYDASYLYLALRERAALASLDVELRAAAVAAGVELFT
jgi:predicted nucleic acid-binding protein